MSKRYPQKTCLGAEAGFASGGSSRYCPEGRRTSDSWDVEKRRKKNLDEKKTRQRKSPSQEAKPNRSIYSFLFSLFSIIRLPPKEKVEIFFRLFVCTCAFGTVDIRYQPSQSVHVCLPCNLSNLHIHVCTSITRSLYSFAMQ